MSLALCARGFEGYVFPSSNVANYVYDHENYRNGPCILSTFERVDELTPIVNGTNDVRNAFLSTCEFKTERDNQEHIYYTSEDGDRLDAQCILGLVYQKLADMEKENEDKNLKIEIKMFF